MPQIIFDNFLINFQHFITLLGASDVAIVEKSAQNILAFIHFSMIQGIVRNDLLVIKEEQLQFILPAFKTDKTSVCKNLIKSLYWALSLNKSNLLSTPYVFRWLEAQPGKRKENPENFRKASCKRGQEPDKHCERSGKALQKYS